MGQKESGMNGLNRCVGSCIVAMPFLNELHRISVQKLVENWFAMSRILQVYSINPVPQHHDIKRIKKAAKKAKTFETQKVIKKLKDLRLVRELVTTLESSIAAISVRRMKNFKR